ncbi:MAG: GMC family oxidoreductase [Burkholderiaceae bacterium]
MLIDSRSFTGASVQADICIVGAGPAGITLAMQLAGNGLDVCLIESGGLQPDPSTLRLNRGYNLGLPYSFGPGDRSRHLGGSSNCWGGFSQPWNEWDHFDRPWVRDSGWPFLLDELQPYYERARNLLKIDRNQFRIDWWSERLAGPDLARFPLDKHNLEDAMSALTPIRFGEYWREALAQSRRIRVLLWANATELVADEPATHIQKLRVRTLAGNAIDVDARRFVLACGGIETPRLMLASRAAMPAGIGNGHGLVGRYFMDHPRLRWGRVQLREAFRGNRLYDVAYNYIHTPLRHGDLQGSAVFRLPYEVQRSERLTNSQIWLRSLFRGETAEIVNSLVRMRRRLRAETPAGFEVLADLKTLGRHPIASGLTALGYLSGSHALVDRIVMEGIFEPEPNPESRVSLSGDLDAVGMPRAQIDWRLTANDRRAMERTMHLVADELERQDIADVDREADPAPGTERAVEGTWHYMGTTRMHASPARGVVDANCKVHGMGNLFIAGSSVFPTGGANHPTIQLLALAYRLGDHLIAGHGDRPVVAQTKHSAGETGMAANPPSADTPAAARPEAPDGAASKDRDQPSKTL